MYQTTTKSVALDKKERKKGIYFISPEEIKHRKIRVVIELAVKLFQSGEGFKLTALFANMATSFVARNMSMFRILV